MQLRSDLIVDVIQNNVLGSEARAEVKPVIEAIDYKKATLRKSVMLKRASNQEVTTCKRLFANIPQGLVVITQQTTKFDKYSKNFQNALPDC